LTTNDSPASTAPTSLDPVRQRLSDGCPNGTVGGAQ